MLGLRKLSFILVPWLLIDFQQAFGVMSREREEFL
jgi:hypothetical protein